MLKTPDGLVTMKVSAMNKKAEEQFSEKEATARFEARA